ncbi:MAG: tyrosine-type recombinase/integrase [Janthinobacterium lividum]
MPVHFDKTEQRWRFKFDRVITGRQFRASRLLPKGWSKAEANAYDQRETARLYDVATGKAEGEPLIAAAVKLYVEERCPQLKHGDNQIKVLAYIGWSYKDKTMDKLPEVAQELCKFEVGKVAPATIKNRIAYLRAACGYYLKAQGKGKKVPSLVMPVVSNERKIFIDRRQMLQLARLCKHRETRKVIRIAFYSGMRLSEILRCGASAGVFELHDTKNGESRNVPIHPKIASLARLLPIRTQRGMIQRSFREARDAFNMPELHLHDVRHSAASNMVNAGVDLYVVGQVLGHRDLRSTKRYSHLNTDTLMAAIRKIG